MKIKNTVTLGVIALIVIGAAGLVSSRVMAQGSATPQDRQVQATEIVDTDNVDEQVGDQNEVDTGTEAAEAVEIAGAPDTDNVDEQVGDQNGADTGTEVIGAGETSEGQEPAGQEADTETDQAALQAQAQITMETAQQAALAANPGGTILTTQLDDENGTLVYGVEFADGQNVKVDAMTGTVLSSEIGEN